jgi:hypothetical protein
MDATMEVPEYTEDELFDMSDEELASAVKDTRSAESSVSEEPESEPENENDKGTEEEEKEEIEEDENSDSIGSETEEELNSEDEELNTVTGSQDETIKVADKSSENASESTEKSKSTNKSSNKSFDDVVKNRPIKIDGTDIKVESLDELYTLAESGINSKKELSKLSQYKDTINIFKEFNLTDEDLSMLIDLKKGDKDAIAQVLKEANIDPIDLDTEDSRYTRKSYSVDSKQIEIKDIVAEISQDKEYEITTRVVDGEWDKASRDILRKDPIGIKVLHNDIKSGLYQKAAPEALKLELLDGGRKSKVEYYAEASKRIIDALRAENESKSSNTPNNPTNVRKKKAAAPTKSRATNVKTNDTPDYENMSEEEFEKLYKKIMGE